MRRGFIFTMDAIIAMVPIFIIIAAVTTSSNPQELAGMQISSVKDSMVASNSLYVVSRGDMLTDVARYVVSGDDDQAEAVAGRWLNSTIPDNFKYRMEMTYSNGTSVDVVGTDPPEDAFVSATSQVVPVFLGGEGYLGQAWYVGVPPSINMDVDEVMSDQNGDGVVNGSDEIYLGWCESSSFCIHNSSYTDALGWYEFNFTVPGTPVFTAFVFTTNSDHHRYLVQIKNANTGGWVQVADIEQLWHSVQVDLTKWTIGSGNLNEMRVKVYGNAHMSYPDGGSPLEANISGNSVVVSTYGTGVNVKVDINDSDTDPVMFGSPGLDDWTLTLTTPAPASYGRLSFTRLYLPVVQPARLRVWVDGTVVFDVQERRYQDIYYTAIFMDLTGYLKSEGTHTLRVRRDTWTGGGRNPAEWYASPSLIRAYISGPVLLQVVNMPYNPPFPKQTQYPNDTYTQPFTLPDSAMPTNVSITNAIYLLNADQDADTVDVDLNNITEINGTDYGYMWYKFVTDDLLNGSNTVTTTLNNTKNDNWAVEGPGNQLLIGYEMGKLAFASGPGSDIETAKKKALEELLIKMGYDTSLDGSISNGELDNVKGSGILSYSGAAPSDWVTNTGFLIDWAVSDTKATAAQRTGQDPQQVVFKLYIWRE